MALPLSSVVTVSITVSSEVPAAAGFGTAGIVSDESTATQIPQQPVEYFSSATELADRFGASSEAYKCGSSYFGQNPRPKRVGVVRAGALPATSGSLTSNGSSNTVADWVAIGATGSAKFVIDGVASDVTGVDFTAVTSMTDVASAIQTGVQAVATGGFTSATVVYSGSEFVIKSGTTGASSTVGFTSSAASGAGFGLLMGTESTQGGSIVNGAASQTLAESLESANSFDNGWYGVLAIAKFRDNADAATIVAFAQGKVKLFGADTNDPTTLQGSPSSFAGTTNTGNNNHTMCVYSSQPTQYPAAAALARLFVVNYTAPDSAITLKFKQLSGINTEDLSTTQKGNLDSLRCNAQINIGGLGYFAESFMAGSLFADERHALDALQGDLESRLFAYIAGRPTKVPLTDAGGAALQSQVIASLDQFRRAGVIGTGTTADGEFLENGYTTSVQRVADMNPADKAQRISPTVSFLALFAGAVHFINIVGTVER